MPEKTVTEEVEGILTKGLEGENIDAMLASLSPFALKIWEDMLTQFRKSGDSELYRQLKVADYVEEPATMNEFLEDPYYLGSLMVKSQESEGMFPAWKEILCRDFNYDSAIHNCVITGSLGTGKCWSELDELILFDGSLRRASHIKAGDVLLGDDSTPRTVVSVCRGRGEMFEIIPVKGESFTVNEDHVLVLKSTNSEEIVEVALKDFLKWPREKKHKACLYRVSTDWDSEPLPIDPYIMGLWLGDGHTGQTALTTMDQELADAWINYGRSIGVTENFCTAGKKSLAKSIQLSAKDSAGRVLNGKNELRNRLQKLGLMQTGAPADKFIPRVFLANSRKNRLELLAGLVDTDGHFSKNAKAGHYEITFKLKKLADQTRFLAQSLGYFAKTSIKVANSTAYFRTNISGAYDIPVRLHRKKSPPRPASRISNLTGDVVNFNVLKSRFAIVPVGKRNYYGFTLTGDGRCLMRDFTVTHNSFCLVTIILYRLLIALLLRNPHNFFGLTKGTKIIFNLLSVTKAAVTETVFGDAMTFMANSPFFLESGFNPDITYTNFRIPFKNSLMLTAGSKGQHLLGRNIIGVGLDEGNWRLEAEPDTKAYELFNEVRNRINNRFRKVAGYLPAISILASSARDESSFTETIVNEIQKANEPSTQRVYRHAVYKIKRHTLRLGPRWFKVAYGLKNIMPMMLSGWYTEQSEPIVTEGETHEEPPSGASIELVPEMYQSEFKRRPLNALRDVCGISTGGVNRWFSTMIDFERCTELAIKDGVENPVIGGQELIPLSTEDRKQLWEYLEHKKFCTLVQSQVLPKRHPGNLRYAHIDLATQSMCGLAICHLVGTQLVENLVKDGIPFSEYRLIVEYDFILTIVAGAVKPISMEKIQNFIIWLRQECGYNFGLVSFDQWNSAMQLQMLEARGFKVDQLSIDRNKEVYTAWRSAVEELRLRPYVHRHMMWEAENLLNCEKKVDHPSSGSKDTTDGCAGAYFGAINSEEKASMMVPNNPRIITTRNLEGFLPDKPLVEINLPDGYTRMKTFKV